MIQKFKKFTKLSAEEKKLFMEAYITLGMMRTAILTVSFKLCFWRGKMTIFCTSSGSRSLFLPKKVAPSLVAEPKATIESHIITPLSLNALIVKD